MLRKALFLVWSITSAFGATILYTAEKIDLGFTPTAMNDNGWIVGYRTSGRVTYPMRYRPGVGREQISSQTGRLVDINDAGTAIGYIGGQNVIRAAGEAWRPLDTTGTLDDAGLYAINNAGHVVGSDFSEGKDRPFVYREGSGVEYLDMPLGDWAGATDINDAGQIAAFYGIENPRDIPESPPWDEWHTLLFDSVTGGYTDAGKDRGDFFKGTYISESGIIAGQIAAPRATAGRAAVYIPSQGIRRLGTLGTGEKSFATAINGRGWVVGNSRMDPTPSNDNHAFLYVYGRGMMDLNDLVLDLDTVLAYAYAINDRDQILVKGTDKNYYLLSRVRETSPAGIDNPEPATWLLFPTGALILSFVRRRKSSSSKRLT